MAEGAPTKKRLYRRPQIAKSDEKTPSSISFRNKINVEKSSSANVQKRQENVVKVASKLAKSKLEANHEAPALDKLKDALQTTSLKSLQSSSAQIAKEKSQYETTSKKYSTPHMNSFAESLSNKPLSDCLQEKYQQKYGPKPYRSLGPESFPMRRPKALPELQKGVVLKSWNDSLKIPNYKSYNTLTESASRLSSYLPEKEYENVFATLEKPIKLLRPQSLYNLPTFAETPPKREAPKTQGKQRRRRRGKKVQSSVEVAAGYDPNELLDAICDWKPEKSFDEMFQARRKSVLIPIQDRAKNRADLLDLKVLEATSGSVEDDEAPVALSVSASARLIQPLDQFIYGETEQSEELPQSLDDDFDPSPHQTIKIPKIDFTAQLENSIQDFNERHRSSGSLTKFAQYKLHQLHKKQQMEQKMKPLHVGSREKVELYADDGPALEIKGNSTNDAEYSYRESWLEDPKLSSMLLDLTSLGEKKPRVPKHMILLALKQHLKTKIKENEIQTPDDLFSSEVLQNTLLDIDKISEKCSISQKDRVKAVIGATDEYFNQLLEEEKKLSQEEKQQEVEAPATLTATQMEVLASLADGGQVLSLKAHFLKRLPDVSPLIRTLVCLNLSFNNFNDLPEEVLDCQQLQFLKLRDNPIRRLPPQIYKLKKLRSLVVSFCCLTDLPSGVYLLRNLEFLDVSYNLLTHLSREIENLSHLKYLNLEGNELIGLPCTMLSLDPIRVRIKNNYMSPAFWPETSLPEIPKLSDLCLTMLERYLVSPEVKQLLNEDIAIMLCSYSTCDCCGKPMYGPGLHVLRHRRKIWGLRQVPFVFNTCSLKCHTKFSTSKEADISTAVI